MKIKIYIYLFIWVMFILDYLEYLLKEIYSKSRIKIIFFYFIYEENLFIYFLIHIC